MGRGLRPSAGKAELVVLDEVGSTWQHGVLTGPVRSDYSWEQKAAAGAGGGGIRGAGNAPSAIVRRCACGALMHRGLGTCPGCGKSTDSGGFAQLGRAGAVLARMSVGGSAQPGQAVASHREQMPEPPKIRAAPSAYEVWRREEAAKEESRRAAAMEATASRVELEAVTAGRKSVAEGAGGAPFEREHGGGGRAEVGADDGGLDALMGAMGGLRVDAAPPKPTPAAKPKPAPPKPAAPPAAAAPPAPLSAALPATSHCAPSAAALAAMQRAAAAAAPPARPPPPQPAAPAVAAPAGAGRAPKAETDCRYFRLGKCRKGASCPFRHGPPQQSPPPPPAPVPAPPPAPPPPTTTTTPANARGAVDVSDSSWSDFEAAIVRITSRHLREQYRGDEASDELGRRAEVKTISKVLKAHRHEKSMPPDPSSISAPRVQKVLDGYIEQLKFKQSKIREMRERGMDALSSVKRQQHVERDE